MGGDVTEWYQSCVAALGLYGPKLIEITREDFKFPKSVFENFRFKSVLEILV
jgi:hypothetical protein